MLPCLWLLLFLWGPQYRSLGNTGDRKAARIDCVWLYLEGCEAASTVPDWAKAAGGWKQNPHTEHPQIPLWLPFCHKHLWAEPCAEVTTLWETKRRRHVDRTKKITAAGTNWWVCINFLNNANEIFVMIFTKAELHFPQMPLGSTAFPWGCSLQQKLPHGAVGAAGERFRKVSFAAVGDNITPTLLDLLSSSSCVTQLSLPVLGPHCRHRLGKASGTLVRFAKYFPPASESFTVTAFAFAG